MPIAIEEKACFKLRHSAGTFNEKVLGGKSWSGQDKIFDAISQYDNVAVKSAHALSKSYTFSRAGLWFLSCFPPAIVIATAPTDRQVEHIFWSEVTKAYSQANKYIGGQILKKLLRIREDWYMLAFKSRDYDPSYFQGFHAPNVMIIMDEASGIARPIWDAVEGLKVGNIVKHLVGGQPFDSSSAFADCFRDPTWHKIHLSGYDSPNITGECNIPGLMTKEWMDDKKRKWGEDSVLFTVRGLGEFPEASEDTLITLAQIHKAIERECEIQQPFVMGIDVGRYGDDSSVFTITDSYNNEIRVVEHTKRDTMAIAGIAKQLIGQYNIILTGVDVIGIGAGVYDRLIETGEKAIAVNVSNAPEKYLTDEKPESFQNLRAQLYWLYKSIINDIKILDEGRTVEDLSDLHFKIQSNGKIKMESKEEMKKRRKRSPDFADSRIIALYTARQINKLEISDKDIETAGNSIKDQLENDWL